MKRKEIKQLHTKTLDELGKMLNEARKNLVKTRVEMRSEKVKDLRTLDKVRDDIARILTVVRQKQLEEVK